jgi:general secretion pathway protein G
MKRIGITCGRCTGFTLIEIMLVVVIIGILMAVVVPRMAGQSGRAKNKACAASIQGISTALATFEVRASRFPTTQEGLQALITKPSDLDEDEWAGPYLRELPRDPWKQEFIYKCPGEVNKDFDLVSKGKDKTEGTEDDITNFPKSSEGAGQ